MSALDGIAPEFRTDAGMVRRLPVLILVMGVLIAGTIVFAQIVQQPQRWVPATVIAILLLTVCVLYARRLWIKGVKLLETLRDASQLMQTATPQPVQVTSWYLYKNSWYIGIQLIGAQPDASIQAVRVRLPYSRIPIEDPAPAEFFHGDDTCVVRLHDGRTILLATEPDEFERLAKAPLPLPPRHIPIWVQVQMLTYQGAGVAFLCFTAFFIRILIQGISTANSSPLLAFPILMGVIFLVWGTTCLAWGFRAWRRLKSSPLGWAQVVDSVPPKMKWGVFAPNRQTMQLKIYDQEGREYQQQMITRQWLTYWPRHTVIPVLFDPTGREKPQQLKEILGFFRITALGEITYHPVWSAMTVFYFIWAALIISVVLLNQ